MDLFGLVSPVWETSRSPLHIRVSSPSMNLEVELVLSEALIATDIPCRPIMTIRRTSHAGSLTYCCHLSQGQIGTHWMIRMIVAESSDPKDCHAESAYPVFLRMSYFTAGCIDSWGRVNPKDKL